MENTKIFIDTDSEITFTIEKILQARTERVSLVIPDRASILTSLAGLKLLKRVIDKSNKLLVLVTLDPNGGELARKAGIEVVARVGEIVESTWEKVQKTKFDVKKKDYRTYYIPENIEVEDEKATTQFKSIHEVLNDPTEASRVEQPDVQEDEMKLEEVHSGVHEVEIDLDQVKESKETQAQLSPPEFEDSPMPSKRRKTSVIKNGVSDLTFTFGKDVRNEKKN